MQFGFEMTVALGAILVVSQIWSIKKTARNRQICRELRDAAMNDFRKSRLNAQRPEYCFDGESAQIMLINETGIDADSFSLTIYSRNEAGEYFMFKATKDKPWMRHVAHNKARLVLKCKYIPKESHVGGQFGSVSVKP